jgi:hypothetical protein
MRATGVVIDVLPELTTIHSVEELGTTTNTETDFPEIMCPLVNLDFKIVTIAGEIRGDVNLIVQRGIDVSATNEHDDVGVFDVVRLAETSFCHQEDTLPVECTRKNESLPTSGPRKRPSFPILSTVSIKLRH